MTGSGDKIKLDINYHNRSHIFKPEVKSIEFPFIRENAGKLWRLLSTDVHRKWNLQEVKELTGFNDLEVASAIGWLAREDKIQFELEHHDTKDKNALLYLMLNVYF